MSQKTSSPTLSSTLSFPDLISSVRELFPCLTPEDQAELFRTIQQLKAEAAMREADKIKDPMVRFFSQGFAELDRQAAGLPPLGKDAFHSVPNSISEPKQITHAKTRKTKSNS